MQFPMNIVGQALLKKSLWLREGAMGRGGGRRGRRGLVTRWNNANYYIVPTLRQYERHRHTNFNARVEAAARMEIGT